MSDNRIGGQYWWPVRGAVCAPPASYAQALLSADLSVARPWEPGTDNRDGEAGLTHVILRRLQESGDDLSACLDAAYEAFEEMRLALYGRADQEDGFYAGLVFAAAAVADGRDAILSAPSLPPTRLGEKTQRRRPCPAGSAGETAVSMADLSAVLANQLTLAGQAAPAQGDRSACLRAARCAAEIHVLLAGGET